MNPDVLALMTEADKLARVADEVTQAYALELARVLRDAERELRMLAAEALAGSRTALSRAVRAAQIRHQIRLALKAAGYDRLTQAASSTLLDRVLAQVLTLRGAARLAAFTAADLTRVLALQRFAAFDLLTQGDVIAHALWRTLVQGLFSARPIRDVLQDLSDALDVEASEARTLYDTTVSVFGRQVEALKSTPTDVYAYFGPVDRKIRPFCRQHVGKVYTRREIDGLDNGQLPDVFLTGGGYNCRHSWLAVSQVSELRELVGTHKRIPEVEAALQRMPVGGRKAA